MMSGTMWDMRLCKAATLRGQEQRRNDSAGTGSYPCPLSGAAAGETMTQPQILAFLILGGMMVLFIWGRLRYDVVAMLALVASLIAGTVRPDEAFRGFSDDIVIIVGSALVVSAGIARSGVVEVALQWVGRRVTSLRWQLTVLVGSVTLLSAIVKNIGALAMLMPAAFGMAKRSGASPSHPTAARSPAAATTVRCACGTSPGGARGRP